MHSKLQNNVDVADKEEEGRITEDELSTTEGRSRERETLYKGFSINTNLFTSILGVTGEPVSI